MKMARSLRARKQVDYRSAGIGVEEPAWLKVTEKNYDGQQDEENMNPQPKVKQGRGGAKANRKPAVLGDRKQSQEVTGKKRKQPVIEPKTQAPEDQATALGTGENPGKAHIDIGSGRRAKEKKQALEGGAGKREQKGTGNKRHRASPKGTAPSKAVEKQAVKSPGEERSDAVDAEGDPRWTEAENPEDLQQKCIKGIAADATVQVSKSKVPGAARGGGSTNLQKKAAGRGRNAGLIVEDMNEDKVVYQSGKNAITGSMDLQMKVPGGLVTGETTLRAVRGLPGVSMRIPAQSAAPSSEPTAAGQLSSAEEAISWLTAAEAQEAGMLRPGALKAPTNDNSAAFMKLQDSYVSLQDKYRSLKEGTLRDLEATLLASCGSMDRHLQAASELAAHWKEEAEKQAALAQTLASGEIHNQLCALKEEAAALRTARLEAEVRLGDKEDELLAALHTTELAEARAAAAEAELLRLRNCNKEDKATQAALEEGAPSKGEKTGSDGTEPRVSAASGGNAGAESMRSGHHSSTHPGPTTCAVDVVPEVDGGKASEEGAEEEIVVLEICLNEGWGQRKEGAPATPCSLIRRRSLSRELACQGGGSGPVRVIFTTSSAAGSSISCPLPPAPVASPVRQRRLSGLVADAQQVLMEPTPKRSRQTAVGNGLTHENGAEAQEITATISAAKAPQVSPATPAATNAGSSLRHDSSSKKAKRSVQESGGPLEALTGFRRLQSAEAGGLETYVHEPSGFAFELGPAAPASSGSAAASVGDDDEAGTEELDMAYRPLCLGNTAKSVPMWLQEPLEFSPSYRTAFFLKVTEAINKAPKASRRHPSSQK